MQRSNYVDEIKRIPIQDVVARLGLKLTRTGNSLQGNCPTGHSSKNGRCFSVHTEDNYFNCFHCKEAGDLISLVEITKDIDFKEAVRWLANEFNIVIPDNIKSDSHDVDPEFYQRAALNDAIFEYGKYLLYESDGGEARDYLINERGYTEDSIKQTEWILFPPQNIIKSHLLGKFPDAAEQIKKLHLDSFNEVVDWVAFPYRNRDGIITGFLKRALVPKGYNLTNYRGETFNNLRWHSTMGTNKHDLFNLHRCKGYNTLIIVEGYPDTLLFPTLGLDNIVAVGQGKLAKSHLEGLDEFGIKNIIISFDNDPPDAEGHRPGYENSIDSIKLLLTKSRINVFIIDPDKLAPHKDPDEYVKDKGIGAFKNLINRAESGAKWLAKVIADKYDLTKDIEKQKALDEASEFITDIKIRIAADQFESAIANALAMNIDSLKQYFGDYKERCERARLSEEYKKFNASAEALRRKGDLEGEAKLIDERGLELKNELYKTKIKSLAPLADRLMEKYNAEKNRTAALLGYPLTKFQELCTHIDGVQPGLYLIGAETNIGKTAMLTNLSLDIIQSNSDVRVLYFSMDDSWNVIINRFLGILTEIDLNQVQRRQTIPDNVRKLKQANDYLISLSEQDRFFIKDLSEVSTYDQIEAVIREYYDGKLSVFLDGLYNVEVTSSGNIREMNIERANKLKTLVDSYHVPILCTAELRKKTKEEGKNKPPTIHDFMETGKFGYNANVAWLLSSEYNNKILDEIPIKLNYEKNKLSHYKGYQDLIFIRNKGIVKEGIAPVLNLANNLLPSSNGDDIDFT